MSLSKKIIVACSIAFSVFIVLLGEDNQYYHSKEVVNLDGEVATLANSCKDGQYYISAKGYCATCPSGYNHSDGARNSKANCYLITEPGYFVPKSESKPIDCRLDTYSEGGVKVYYYKTSFCTMCPDGTGTDWKWTSTSKDKCTKEGFRGHDKCTWYNFNIEVGQVFEDWCTYNYGTKTDIKLTNSNSTSLSAVVTNGDDKTNAVITYKGLKPGRATISYTFNGTKDTYTINVLCEGGKYLSSDGKSCVISCPSGEKEVEGVCEKQDTTPKCKDNEELKDGKCVTKVQPTQTCKDNEELKDGKCVTKVQPTQTCKDNEELKDGKCVKKEDPTPTKSCKDDEELVNGKCVSKKDYPCNRDEKLVDNKCVKIINKCYITCDDEYVWGDYENQACYNPVDDITSEEDCHKKEEVKPPVVEDNKDNDSKKTLIFLICFVVVIIIAMFISASFSNKKKITVSKRKVNSDDGDYNDFSNYYK